MQALTQYGVLAILALMIMSACGGKEGALPDAESPAGPIAMLVELPAGAQAADHAILPAPGNLGNIIETKDGSGKGLSCLVLGAAVKKGSRLEIWPVAAVQWHIGKELHTCIIAIRTESGRAPGGIEDFMALRMSHDDVRMVLERWFRYHYLPRHAEWSGWQNEVYAFAEIERRRGR